jgi:malonate transporter MadL subunit
MTIHGVGILAFCYLAGQLVGELLGKLLGINANVGGVGFAMILLITINEWMSERDLIKPPARQGVLFWSAMYIPVIIAMSATQNVKAAFSGGFVALLAGIIPTLGMLFLVPIVSRLSKKENHD